MAGFFDKLEQSIGKYGGEDEAYKLKLKTGIRESLGYSNYVSQRKQAAGEDLDLSLLKGDITPGGVKEIVGGAIGMKDDNVDTLDKMVSATDTAADQLATAQAAREKTAAEAARNKIGLDNGVAFSASNPMESMVKDFMQNPKNPDGSMKSVQQLEAEMNASLGMQEGYSPEDIKKTLDERLPSDYMGNEDKYFMMSMGFSEKQAIDNAGALRYDQMNDAEKIVFELQSPKMANYLSSQEEKSSLQSLIKDATETTTEEMDGRKVSSPKYTFQELVGRHPELTAAEVKRLAIQPYKADLNSSIEESLGEVVGQKSKGFMKGDEDETLMDQLRSVYNKEIEDYPEGGIVSVKKSPMYQELKAKLEGLYAGTFSSAEVEDFLFNNIDPRL